MNALKLSGFRAATDESGAQATLLLGGDLCPIKRYETKILQGEDVFDGVLHAAFRDNDFCLVNLEAPLCAGDIPCNNPGERGLRADPEIAGFLHKLGVNAAGLANNHIRDFGNEGYRQTAASLDLHQVLHTGAGRNLAEAQLPLAVTVKGLKVGIWALAEKELNVASENAAGSSWFRPGEDFFAIREMRKAYDFLLIFVHAGHEFMSTPSPRIRAAYRRLVDAGADAVIGHHPHVVQGAERYKDALIAYSLGNLVFDSPYVSAHPDTDLGYLLRLGISNRGVTAAELIPYKLREQIVVSSLESEEHEAFARLFAELSDNITDDARFMREWERNVAFRWENEFKAVIDNLPKNLRDVDKIGAPRRIRNLFTCPTHVELLGQAFDMMAAGQIPRV
jgi:poly-gamma-glutamate synthesis protein (capsule biosynthesis protein)